MEKAWELYRLAEPIIKKICHNKCFYLKKSDIEEDCQDYIKDRLMNNNFSELKKYDPTKGAKEETFLHIVISGRVIDFFKTAKHRRELHVFDSISETLSNDTEVNDYAKILNEVIEELSYEEQTYLKLFYVDGFKHKEIDEMFPHATSKASKKLENIRKKLKRKLEKLNYKLEDIL